MFSAYSCLAQQSGDSSTSPAVVMSMTRICRRAIMPRSPLTGEANLLVLPGIDAANISYNLLKTAAGNNVAIGPVLLGAAKPVHVLTPSATVRRIVNMTAWAVVDADSER